MARAHFVKKARKDYPEHGIKKGESYWWWAFMTGRRGGPKRYSKTKPKRSQLTNSEYLSTVYGYDEEAAEIEAAVCDADSLRDAASSLEDLAGRIRETGEEQREKYENMPEGLQQGDTGQLLEARADACERIAEELESLASELQQYADEHGDEEKEEEDQEADFAGEAQRITSEIDWTWE